ncbi:ParB/RepB/Spo0J family partition protein [Knoellia sp. LjRoot47]|uniref:ParB/RepB/Spo0J family partition protein n=1 Tax=Knoellia sp. LjRoot47 TaxID=3342330 RepID=UPI003ECCADB4
MSAVAGAMPVMRFQMVPIRDLRANPANVREQLEEIGPLASSIRTQGILQPLIVNRVRGAYLVTDGHRRLAAAKLAMVPAAPCLVTSGAGARDVIATMCAAAMHQELTPMEQARAFDRLRAEGMTTAEVALTTGYSPKLVRQRLLLLNLPQEAQDLLDEGTLTVTAAAELAATLSTAPKASAALRAPKQSYLGRAHPLAARLNCTHRDVRILVGGVACGQCWEQAIVDDAVRS